jgi:uncharacterized repeat protein (TIGR02543 family)
MRTFEQQDFDRILGLLRQTRTDDDNHELKWVLRYISGTTDKEKGINEGVRKLREFGADESGDVAYRDELTFAVVDAPAGVHIDHDTMLVIDAGARSGGLLEFSLTADDGDTSVTLPARVTISETTYSLTLDTSSTGGSVVLSPSRATWRWGDSLTLTARPDEGYRFDSWSGDTSTADTVLTVVMTDDMSLTASFSLIPGACQPVAAGTSLNAAIKQASGAETKPQWLCPAEGKYESGTVEVWGTVKVAIE